MDLNGQMKRRRPKKKQIILIAAAAIVVIIITASLQTQTMKRFYKSVFSDYTGGLRRTVTVYDGNGKVLKSWSGKVDVEENDYGNKVLFDIDGKRKAIYNAPVIIEEE